MVLQDTWLFEGTIRENIVYSKEGVDRRCAITKEVRPAISLSIAFWIRISVRVSTELVASSRISMGAFSIIAPANEFFGVVEKCAEPLLQYGEESVFKCHV